MKQWEIYLYPFDVELPHPAVIISNDERCEDSQFTHVNALICTSVRLNRPPKMREIALDEADGLDWKTAVRCDVSTCFLNPNSSESVAWPLGPAAFK